MHTLRPLACCVLTAPLLANPLSAQNVAYRVAGGTVGGQNNFGGARGMDFIAQLSADLVTWNSGVGFTELVRETANGDGTSIVTWRSARPIGTGTREFMRIVATNRP